MGTEFPFCKIREALETVVTEEQQWECTYSHCTAIHLKMVTMEILFVYFTTVLNNVQKVLPSDSTSTHRDAQVTSLPDCNSSGIPRGEGDRIQGQSRAQKPEPQESREDISAKPEAGVPSGGTPSPAPLLRQSTQPLRTYPRAVSLRRERPAAWTGLSVVPGLGQGLHKPSKQ